MKKIIIIMGILSLLGCNKYRKVYFIDTDFNKMERKLKISSSDAIKIYDNSFYEKFNVKEKPQKEESLYRVIYIIIFII